LLRLLQWVIVEVVVGGSKVVVEVVVVGSGWGSELRWLPLSSSLSPA